MLIFIWTNNNQLMIFSKKREKTHKMLNKTKNKFLLKGYFLPKTIQRIYKIVQRLKKKKVTEVN